MNDLKKHKHHYPYFIRWYDDFSVSGKMIERHCYCFKCEKAFIIRLHPKRMSIEHMNFGLDRGRETIDKLRKQQPKLIREYNSRIKVLTQNEEGAKA